MIPNKKLRRQLRKQIALQVKELNRQKNAAYQKIADLQRKGYIRIGDGYMEPAKLTCKGQK